MRGYIYKFTAATPRIFDNISSINSPSEHHKQHGIMAAKECTADFKMNSISHEGKTKVHYITNMILGAPIKPGLLNEREVRPFLSRQYWFLFPLRYGIVQERPSDGSFVIEAFLLVAGAAAAVV